MVVKLNNMEKQVRSELKGGKRGYSFSQLRKQRYYLELPALVLYDNSTGR